MSNWPAGGRGRKVGGGCVGGAGGRKGATAGVRLPELQALLLVAAVGGIPHRQLDTHQ